MGVLEEGAVSYEHGTPVSGSTQRSRDPIRTTKILEVDFHGAS